MSQADRLVSLYVDTPGWCDRIRTDDFVVAEGERKSNSVYHVASVRVVPLPERRMYRQHLKAYRSDLITCIRRSPEQRVITMRWRPRTRRS